MKFIDNNHQVIFNQYIDKDDTSIHDVERYALFYIIAGCKNLREKGIQSFYDF
ncbi:hypothetical protein HZI73_10715 [Vallitalea pronyensis]|uniref:Uncharacterized protein n=1 Tax=Vallitalea pronyensis TaxID=1348613 RepID=A0A8J8MK38_9FIRM|nr:DUF6075 family protein [Vallitalea pronyensis]QUI22733.1 hypothetical protein HZI73_10715 [Vallitalea pronyensis]